MSPKRTTIIVVIMLFTLVFLRYINHSEEIKPNKPFSTFPKKIGEWEGKEGRFDQSVYDALGVDDSYLGHFHTPDGRYVQLYVGFYQSQKEGELIHSPKNCMPGGGWNITGTSIVELNIPGNVPSNIDVIRLDLLNGRERQVAFYWYQSRGRFVISEYWEKIYLVIDSITKRRTDGSFVRLIAPVINNDEEKALADLKDFASQLVPVLQEFLPE
ncbi:MAG: EpsI family protein [Desulfatiglans sp.]|jgi:EpsI family protein|nr:EpsI family protein [Desulfatiglans sp.]